MSSPSAKANPGVEQSLCSGFGGAELLTGAHNLCSLSRCHQQTPWISFHFISFHLIPSHSTPHKLCTGISPSGSVGAAGFCSPDSFVSLGSQQKIPNRESVKAVLLAHATSPDPSKFHQSWPYFMSQSAKLPTLSVRKPL